MQAAPVFPQDAVLHDMNRVLHTDREKLAFSVQAHVFQIDQQTKKRWLPSSAAAIRVAYYHDPSRKTYRIIAIDNSKVLVVTVFLECLCELRRKVNEWFVLCVVWLLRMC